MAWCHQATSHYLIQKEWLCPSSFDRLKMSKIAHYITCINPATTIAMMHGPTCQGYTGPHLNLKTIFPRMGIPLLKTRWSWVHLIFNIQIPILGRWYLYTETDPWIFPGTPLKFNRAHENIQRSLDRDDNVQGNSTLSETVSGPQIKLLWWQSSSLLFYYCITNL